MKLEYNGDCLSAEVINMTEKPMVITSFAFGFDKPIARAIFNILCKLGLGKMSISLTIGGKE